MKFAARLNGFKTEGKKTLEILKEISEIDKINYVDLNYPEHFKDLDLHTLKKFMEESNIKINSIALRFREEFKNGEEEFLKLFVSIWNNFSLVLIHISDILQSFIAYTKNMCCNFFDPTQIFNYLWKKYINQYVIIKK